MYVLIRVKDLGFGVSGVRCYAGSSQIDIEYLPFAF